MKISSEAQPSGTATGRSQGELGERLLSSPRCKVVTVSLEASESRPQPRRGGGLSCGSSSFAVASSCVVVA